MIPNGNHTNIIKEKNNLITDPTTPNSASISDFSGTGIKNNVTEYGEGYFQNNGLDLSTSDKASITIPEDWQGNNLLVNVTNIYEYNKLWINDTFDNGYDANHWTYHVSDPTYDKYVNFGWYNDSLGNNDSLYMKFTNGTNTWTNVNSYWNYSFYLDREKIAYQSWQINFNYRLLFNSSLWLASTGGASIYAALLVNGIEANFKLIKFNSIKSNTRYSSNIAPFDPEMYGFLPPGRVDLLIGIDYANGYATGATDSLITYIDNVTLNIPNIPRPEQIDLRVNDETNNQNYAINNLNNEFGIGQTSIADIWPGAVGGQTHYFDFTSNSSANVIIYSDFFINATSSKYTTTDQGDPGSTYTVLNSTNVQWEMYFSVNIPGSYETNYYFNISKPKNWVITHLYDPYGNDKIENVTETAGSGNTTLVIPNGITVNGRWKIIAESPNYVLNGDIWKLNGNWQKEKNFKIGDALKVNATLGNNLIPRIDLTNATQVIYYPNGTVWGQLTEVKSVNLDNTVDFSSFLIPQNAPAGQYTVQIRYKNNESSQVGLLIKNFNVIHNTELKRANTQQKLVKPVFSGDTVNIKVNYTDLDFSEGIYGAAVSYSVYNQSSVNFGTGTMTYFGGGVYISEIDTAGWKFGTYNITVSAFKNYYDTQNETNLIQIDVTKSTSIESPDEVGLNVPYGNNVTIDIFYNTSEGTGISGATIDCNWNKSYYFVKSTPVDGHYQILVNSSARSIGTEIITVNATKSGYEYQEINIPLTIRTIFTSIEYSQPAPVELNSNITFTVNFIDTDNNVNISDATLLISNNSNSEYWDAVDFYYYENGDGSYTVTLNTSYFGNVGTYSIYITAEKSLYATSKSLINLFIGEISTSISNVYINGVQTNSKQVFWNSTINIHLCYNDSVGTYLDQAAISLNNGSEILCSAIEDNNLKQYNLTINSKRLLLGVNTFTIIATKANYESSTKIITITVNERPTSLVLNLEGVQQSSIDVFYGNTLNISAIYKDSITSTFISGATVELRNGSTTINNLTKNSFFNLYNLTLDTTTLGIGTHVLNIYTKKDNYTASSMSITITINKRPTTLYVEVNGESTDNFGIFNTSIGEILNITAYYHDNSNNFISGATVTLSEESYSGTFTKYLNFDQYNLSLDTLNLKTGIKFITISAESENYSTFTVNFKLNIKEIKTDLAIFFNGTSYKAENNVYKAELDSKVNITIIYNESLSGDRIQNGSVNLINYGNFDENTQFHYYNFTLDVSSLNKGINFLNVYADKENYQSASLQFTIEVIEKQTKFDLFLNNQNKTLDRSIDVTIGEKVNVSFIYEDLSNNYISNASVQISGEGINKVLNESIVHNLYYTIIDSNDLNYGVNFLTLYAKKLNYQPQTIIIKIEIIDKETSLNIFLNGVNKTIDRTIELPIGASLNITAIYDENVNQTYISNALVRLEGEGLSLNLTEYKSLHQYSIVLNTKDLDLGVRFLTIYAQKINYQSRTLLMRIQVDRIKTNITTVSGKNSFNIQTGQSITLQIQLENLDFGGLIKNATVEYSSALGQGYLTDPDGDGIYTTSINNVPQGTYTFTITVYAGDNYEFERYQVTVTATTPKESVLLFQILTILGIGAAIGITGYLFAYQKVLKYPKPVRKIHKYEKMMKKGSKKELEIQSREEAIRSKFKEEYDNRVSGKKFKESSESESRREKLKSVEDKISKD